MNVVGAQLLNNARARRASRDIEAVFQRFNHDELRPLFDRLVEMGFTPKDAARLLGAALRMAGDGIAVFDG